MAVLQDRPEQNTTCSGELQPLALCSVQNQLYWTCLNKPEIGQKQNNRVMTCFHLQTLPSQLLLWLRMQKQPESLCRALLWGYLSLGVLSGSKWPWQGQCGLWRRAGLLQQLGCSPARNGSAGPSPASCPLVCCPALLTGTLPTVTPRQPRLVLLQIPEDGEMLR